jgi:hypothetical protein
MRHPWLLTDELENMLMTTLEDATALKDAKALSQQLAAFDDLPRSPLETVQGVSPPKPSLRAETMSTIRSGDGASGGESLQGDTDPWSQSENGTVRDSVTSTSSASLAILTHSSLVAVEGEGATAGKPAEVAEWLKVQTLQYQEQVGEFLGTLGYTAPGAVTPGALGNYELGRGGSQTFVGAKGVVQRGISGRASPEEQPSAGQPGSMDTGNTTSVGLGETVSSTAQFSSIGTLSVPRGSSPEEERLSMEEERPIMSDHHEANAKAVSEDEQRAKQQRLRRENSKALWEAELAAELEHRKAGGTWGTGKPGSSAGQISIAQAVRPPQQQKQQQAVLAGMEAEKLLELHESGIIDDQQFTDAVQAQPDIS